MAALPSLYNRLRQVTFNEPPQRMPCLLAVFTRTIGVGHIPIRCLVVPNSANNSGVRAFTMAGAALLMSALAKKHSHMDKCSTFPVYLSFFNRVVTRIAMADPCEE